jgi:hypothetical protein
MLFIWTVYYISLIMEMNWGGGDKMVKVTR